MIPKSVERFSEKIMLKNQSRVKATDTSPIGSTAWVNSVSSASIMIGGVIEPVMMTSPAASFSPKAASVLATCETMSGSLPVERLEVGGARGLRAAAHEPRGQPCERGAGPGIAAEHHVALVDVAFEHGVEIVRRRYRIEIGELDRREDFFHRGGGFLGGGAGAEICASYARRFPAPPPA